MPEEGAAFRGWAGSTGRPPAQPREARESPRCAVACMLALMPAAATFDDQSRSRADSAARCYVRPDERQFVFIVATGSGYALVETAELWEEPRVGPDADYFCYPTVIGGERFERLEEAEAAVLERYRWAASAGADVSRA